MEKFKIPPISTLAGSTLFDFIEVIRYGRIEKKYYLKTVLTFLIVLIATPFHLWEKLVFFFRLRSFKYPKPPVFIIGHWRSGTTFLHNLLCQAPDAAYLTTYQSTFPNNLASKLLFKTFMRLNMPDKRPSDNVKLNINFPQEDEFAVSNSSRIAYYNFFYFPTCYQRFYREAVRLEMPERTKMKWLENYKVLISKAILNSGGQRVFVKNPVNSGRLLELSQKFPTAKFVFIYRNPITVFLSTRKFFYELIPTLWFHEVNEEHIDDMIYEVFMWIMDDYYTQKEHIEPKRLLEIKFEDFEKEPLKYTQKIYRDLQLDDYEQAEPYFAAYLKEQKGYKKNIYQVPKSLIDKILLEWGDYMEKWDYGIPDDLDVVEDKMLLE